jgi:uncharacterized membrane protein YebE (DUF533 family)
MQTKTQINGVRETAVTPSKLLLSSGLLASVLLAAPLASQAGTRDPGVNQRQLNQQQRIHQGVRSGELTRGEARRLGGEQRQIRAEERAYKSDGHLDRYERADLRHDQNAASRDIYRQKHDAQDRPGAAVRDPGVNAPQQNQRERIGQGVRSGELTRDEAKTLGSQQKAIRAEERSYKSDGVVTRDERKDLHQDLNQASRDIYSQKHDDEKRTGY